jgi:hypothetical protein
MKMEILGNLQNSISGVMLVYSGERVGYIQISDVPVKDPYGVDSFIELVPGGQAIFQISEALLTSLREGCLSCYTGPGDGFIKHWEDDNPPIKAYLLLRL